MSFFFPGITGDVGTQVDTFIFALFGGIVIAFSLFITRVHFERPYGRFLWKRQGIIAWAISKGVPAVLGLLQKFTEKYYLFIPSDKKQRKRLVSAMPGGIHQLSQKDGGVSFSLVDLDVGTTVNPDVAEWADTVLTELSQTHDWPSFLFKWKYATILEALKPRFPKVKDWNPGNDLVTLQMADGSTIQKLAKDCNVTEQAWYNARSLAEESSIKVLDKDTEVTRAMLEAASLNKKHYIGKGGKKMPFQQREKFALARKLNEEFINAKGQIADALLGAKIVTAQNVAGIMRGVPNPEYVDGLREVIREQERLKLHRGLPEIMPYVIAVCAIIGVSALAVVIVHGVIH